MVNTDTSTGTAGQPPAAGGWRRVAPFVALVVLLPLFIGLGLWQLGRAEQKQRLQEEYDERASAAALRVAPHRQGAEELRFHRVEARGVYEPAYQILLDNRVLHGRAGYHVLTPLRIEGSEVRMLVNRGWVPWGESRAQLPEIATPGGPVTVRGIATVPVERTAFRFEAPRPAAGGWQTLWAYLDLDRYGAAVPFPIQPVVVLLDPDSDAGGFTREWSRLDAGIAVHQGYAFQWFALAAALVVIYIALRRRRTPGGESRGPLTS